MYERTYWQDHVLSENGLFNVKAVPEKGADVHSITPFGEVMREGTYQDSAHFNNIEEGLVALDLAVAMIFNLARQNAWEIEKGSIELKNTSKYPANNSQETVSLVTRRENTDYIVIPTVKSFSGNVGEIVITDKLVNGFKVAYTGSAESAVIEYQVIGGYLK